MADLRPVYVAGDGDVKGPASASNNFLPLFAGTTGKLLKSSGTGVTAQGLAILDDNTPAEQRNTIGLNQVNNTSDINKPVSTAQQIALNSKQDKLNYTPVQQGGGIGQSTNKVHIGWSATSKLKVTVDKTDLGNVAFNLDSVNNTSDINKPVSTAQQKAINTAVARYLPLTGGTIKGNLSVTGTTSANGTLLANADFACAGNAVVTGSTILKGGVEVYGVTPFLDFHANNTGADFSARLIAKDNSLIFVAPSNPQVMTLSGDKVSITTPLTVSKAVTIGAAQFATDGNVNGSVWGGWLSAYITNYVNTHVPLVCAAQGASSVGTYALLYIPGQTQGHGWLVNGNSLYWASSAGNANGGIVGIGTWRLMGYINAANTAYSTSLYLRVS